MEYFILLESSSSYGGLGIPLVWCCGNCFLGGLDTKLRKSSIDNWFGIILVRASNPNGSDDGGSRIKLSISLLCLKVIPSKSPTSWLTSPHCESSLLKSKLLDLEDSPSSEMW